MSVQDQVRSRDIPLATRIWSDSGRVVWGLRDLPARQRVRQIRFDVRLEGTCDATDELAQENWPAAIRSVSLGRHLLPLDGLGLSYLDRQIFGHIISSSPAHAATPTTFDIHFQLVVPFADPRMKDPDGSAKPCEMLRNEELDLQFAAAGIYGGVAWVITSGSVHPLVKLVNDEQHASAGFGRAPDNRQLAPVIGGQQINLLTGTYFDILAYKSAFAKLTEAEMAQVHFTIEGMSVLDQIDNIHLRGMYNDLHAVDDRLVLLATGDHFLPIIYPDRKRDAHRLHSPTVVSHTGGVLRFTGTDQTSELAVWRSMPKTEGDTSQIALAQGQDPARSVYESVAEGVPYLTGLQRSILPAKLSTGISTSRAIPERAPRPYERG